MYVIVGALWLALTATIGKYSFPSQFFGMAVLVLSLVDGTSWYFQKFKKSKRRRSYYSMKTQRELFGSKFNVGDLLKNARLSAIEDPLFDDEMDLMCVFFFFRFAFAHVLYVDADVRCIVVWKNGTMIDIYPML